jgi:hypothetical protein
VQTDSPTVSPGLDRPGLDLDPESARPCTCSPVCGWRAAPPAATSSSPPGARSDASGEQLAALPRLPPGRLIIWRKQQAGIMGRVAQVDPDQLAALRRLRAAFGLVEVLEIVEHEPGRDPAPDQAPPPVDEDQASEPEPPNGGRSPGAAAAGTAPGSRTSLSTPHAAGPCGAPGPAARTPDTGTAHTSTAGTAGPGRRRLAAARARGRGRSGSPGTSAAAGQPRPRGTARARSSRKSIAAPLRRPSIRTNVRTG